MVLSGGSAGATSVFMGIDYVSTLLPSTTRLTGAPDAGFFLDAADVAGAYWYRNSFIQAESFWHAIGNGNLNSGCLAAFPSEQASGGGCCLCCPTACLFLQCAARPAGRCCEPRVVDRMLRSECWAALKLWSVLHGNGGG